MSTLTTTNLKHIIKHYKGTDCADGIILRQRAIKEYFRRLKLIHMSTKH
jgi:hypothetical protein